MSLLSFVIPVYQNSGTIERTYQEILGNLPEGYLYEIIFVNDGSRDNSLNEIKEVRSKDQNVKIISLSRNFGQAAAINAGFKHCKGDAVILLSADLQDPCENIPLMVKEWEADNEIVICHRIEREDGLSAKIGSKVFYSAIKRSLPTMPVGGFDFLLVGKKALQEYNQLQYKNRFFQGDILWLGFSVKFIPYKRVRREIGKSQWNLAKKTKYMLDGILNTTYWPIRAMSFLGFISAITGFLYALVVVYARIVHLTPFKGYAPIVIILLVVNGLIMLMLGIIGEYIWRILDEVKGKPNYIIEEIFE
jgi:polyisoprenyl-phosphate glycosyltransferase